MSFGIKKFLIMQLKPVLALLGHLAKIVVGITVFLLLFIMLCKKPIAGLFNTIAGISSTVNMFDKNVTQPVLDLKKMAQQDTAMFLKLMPKVEKLLHQNEVIIEQNQGIKYLIESRTLSKPNIIIPVESTYIAKTDTLYKVMWFIYNPISGKLTWEGIRLDSVGANTGSWGHGDKKTKFLQAIKVVPTSKGVNVTTARFPLHLLIHPQATYGVPVEKILRDSLNWKSLIDKKSLGAKLDIGLLIDRWTATIGWSTNNNVEVGLGYLILW